MIIATTEWWAEVERTGEWVLFRAGSWCSCDSVPSTDVHGGHTHPPDEFVEWAQPCETCEGTGQGRLLVDFGNGGPVPKCWDCLDGKRRIAVAVPCEHPTKLGRWGRMFCDDCGAQCNKQTGYVWSEFPGLVTVGHVVVEWGPTRVVETLPAAPDYECIELVRHKTFRRSALLHFRDGGRMRSRFVDLDRPPGIDPATLHGQWGIGGKVVTP